MVTIEKNIPKGTPIGRFSVAIALKFLEVLRLSLTFFF
jgi:hypothetical protein